MSLREFYVTFGQQYRTETHPTFPLAHPDGWITIVADDETAARTETIWRLGRAWAFFYSDDDPDRPPVYEQGGVSAFPLGELARFTVEAVTA